MQKEIHRFCRGQSYRSCPVRRLERRLGELGRYAELDFTKPYADFDIDEIVRYAKEKGVEIMGHHETGGNIPNYERQMDHAMQWYTDHGIHLLKTGYAGAFPDGYSAS